MRQSIAKLSKMPENLRGYQHGKSANQTHEPIKKDVISSGRERLRCWFVSRKYRALMSHAFGVRHTQFNPCTLEPGLTKIRDTVTLFNLLKRDQGHVGLFLHFVFRLEVGYLSCH